MAGMLPGVECARRRRMIHGGTRRSSSLCLYTISHENHHTSSSSSSLICPRQQKRSLLYKSYNDEELGGATREAEERLDERLAAHRKSETKRSNTKKISSFVERKWCLESYRKRRWGRNRVAQRGSVG